MTTTGVTMEAILAIPGVTWNNDDMRCATPQALTSALEALRSVGYSVRDSRIPDESDPLPYEQATRPNTWTAQLDVTRTKCNSCGQYIDSTGVSVHGHLCEYCGDVTTKELVNGSRICFGFTADKFRGQRPMIIGLVECWDASEGWLYLQDNLAANGVYDSDEEANAALSAYLDNYQDHWEFITKNGKTLVKIRYYPRSFRTPIRQSGIYIYLRKGSKKNFTEVLFWDGIEYKTSQRSELPFTPFVVIRETWRETGWPYDMN